jgi:hypothetical protein
MAEVRSCKG